MLFVCNCVAFVCNSQRVVMHSHQLPVTAKWILLSAKCQALFPSLSVASNNLFFIASFVMLYLAKFYIFYNTTSSPDEADLWHTVLPLLSVANNNFFLSPLLTDCFSSIPYFLKNVYWPIMLPFTRRNFL
jgi:hypothetical protein